MTKRGINPTSPLAALLRSPVRPGRIDWIGLRPGRREPLRPVRSAAFSPETGIVGDHYQSRGLRARQVTLIQREHLAAIAAYLGLEEVLPHQLRRNIVVSGINLLGLPGTRLELGEVLIEVTGACHPCSRMQEIFGAGGYNAVRGHGGVTARILRGGMVSDGDTVSAVPSCEPPAQISRGPT